MSDPTTEAVAFDYRRQCWLRFDGIRFDGAWLWRIKDCDHPDSMRPGCCYSGDHKGETVVHHSEIRWD